MWSISSHHALKIWIRLILLHNMIIRIRDISIVFCNFPSSALHGVVDLLSDVLWHIRPQGQYLLRRIRDALSVPLYTLFPRAIYLTITFFLARIVFSSPPHRFYFIQSHSASSDPILYHLISFSIISCFLFTPLAHAVNQDNSWAENIFATIMDPFSFSCSPSIVRQPI